MNPKESKGTSHGDKEAFEGKRDFNPFCK